MRRTSTHPVVTAHTFDLFQAWSEANGTIGFCTQQTIVVAEVISRLIDGLLDHKAARGRDVGRASPKAACMIPLRWHSGPPVSGRQRRADRRELRGVAVLRAPGLDITLRGLSMVCTDQQTLTHTTPVFDGLYEYYRRATLLGHEPA